MENQILLAYASLNGSTKEVAEAIAETLRRHGLTVDMQPIRKVRSLARYRAVVLGAPLYMFHWHKDALKFLSKFRNALTRALPVAIFAGGPFGKGDEKEWQEVHKQLEADLTKFAWLAPVSVEIVGGKFDPAHLPFPYNLLPALKQVPANDLRDWTAIREWAEHLPAQLQLAGSK